MGSKFALFAPSQDCMQAIGGGVDTFTDWL